jgi:hypothetical protein
MMRGSSNRITNTSDVLQNGNSNGADIFQKGTSNNSNENKLNLNSAV